MWSPISCERDVSLSKGWSDNLKSWNPPTCIAWDESYESLGIGWGDGYVSDYRMRELGKLIKGSAFPGHGGKRVIQIKGWGGGIASLSSGKFALHERDGKGMFLGSAPYAEEEMTCFAWGTQAIRGSAPIAYVGTSKANLWTFDLGNSGRPPRRAVQLGTRKGGGNATKEGVVGLRITERGTLVVGTNEGALIVWDPRSGGSLAHEFKATGGGSLADFDVSGDWLASCGFASAGAARREPFIRAFDMRKGAQLPPTQCPKPPCALRFVPGRRGFPSSSTIFSISPSGGVRVSDIFGGDNARDQFAQAMLPIPESTLDHLAVSQTGEVIAMCDSAGHVHVWSSRDVTELFGGDVPEERRGMLDVVYPDVLTNQPPLPELPVQDFPNQPTVLSNFQHWGAADEMVVGAYFLPETWAGETLASDLPPRLLGAPLRQRKQLAIHPDVLSKVQVRDNIGYAPNAGNLPGLKLLFVKEFHDKVYVDTDPRVKSLGKGAFEEEEEDAEEEYHNDDDNTQLDARLRRIEPKRSKSAGGFSEFDFGTINQTQFAGLETEGIPDAWVNAVMQFAYMIPPLRLAAEAHISKTPNCLATEAGFLFRMLDKSRRVPSATKSCQARNFCRALKASNDAFALGLLEPSQQPVDRRAATFFRYLTGQIASSAAEPKTLVEDGIGVTFAHRDVWGSSQPLPDSVRESVAFVVDLVPPDELRDATLDFPKLLPTALVTERKNRAWCEALRAQTPVTQHKTAVRVPPILIVNCGEGGEKMHSAWRRANFLPASFTSVLPGKKGDEGTDWDVVGIVSFIVDRKNSVGHLVTHCRLMEAYDQESSPSSKFGEAIDVGSWVAFNDAGAFACSEVDAMNFSSPKRRPILIALARRGAASWYGDRPVTNPLPPPAHVSADVFLVPSIAESRIRDPLPVSQILPTLGQGSRVAIDCEFVALSTDHSEFLPDGSRVVTEPSEVTAARVTMLSEDGTVFVDDYVLPMDPVVDFLTRFSGIVPNDLDPSTSRRHLVYAKVAYLKLLYLIDRGCVFVGHGLSSDFRVLNVVVPADQIVDTVDLYWLPGQRRLALRYLASVFLGESIQSKAHDSAEDARAALMLVRKYQELREGGSDEVDAAIRLAYAEGPKRNWVG